MYENKADGASVWQKQDVMKWAAADSAFARNAEREFPISGEFHVRMNGVRNAALKRYVRDHIIISFGRRESPKRNRRRETPRRNENSGLWKEGSGKSSLVVLTGDVLLAGYQVALVDGDDSNPGSLAPCPQSSNCPEAPHGILQRSREEMAVCIGDLEALLASEAGS